MVAVTAWNKRWFDVSQFEGNVIYLFFFLVVVIWSKLGDLVGSWGKVTSREERGHVPNKALFLITTTMTDYASQTDRTHYHALDCHRNIDEPSRGLNLRLFACSSPFSTLLSGLHSSKTRWRMFGNRLLRAVSKLEGLQKLSLNMHDHLLTFLRLPLKHDGGSVMTAGLPAHALCSPRYT